MGCASGQEAGITKAMILRRWQNRIDLLCRTAPLFGSFCFDTWLHGSNFYLNMKRRDG
jgi:hypothetical protein